MELTKINPHSAKVGPAYNDGRHSKKRVRGRRGGRLTAEAEGRVPHTHVTRPQGCQEPAKASKKQKFLKCGFHRKPGLAMF